jgi:nucleotide-binding universal stress UspA family protein
VLGAQRRVSAGAWLFGGTTELVLWEAPAPVLVVPQRSAP